MTNKQKTMAFFLREKGCSFGQIATETGLSANTVKSFFRRVNQPSKASENKEQREKSPCQNPQEKDTHCKCCGVPLQQAQKSKTKKFCNSKCKDKWWNRHRMIMNDRTATTFVCLACKKSFQSYISTKRKYCCHACYIQARYGKEA